MDKLESISVTTRSIVVAFLLAGLVPLAGCRICADCEDLAYPAYGGAWQRTTRDHGRVGSIFDPGGARASELVSRDAPPAPDDLERERQDKRGSKATGPDRRDDDEEPDTEPEERDSQDKEDELRDRKLEDIEEEKENELRSRELDDINVRLIPRKSIPPVILEHTQGGSSS